MQMAQYVPAKAFTLWHHIPRFVVTQVSPVLASSGALMRRMSMSSGVSTSQAEEDASFLDANWRRVERDYGAPREESAELARLSARFMFAENTVGANSEALQCLRKGEGSDWGVCEDYASCAKTLAGREQARDDRVSVRAYFAEKDAMVGSRGQQYFEQCWQAPGAEGVTFVTKKVDGTDHDTLAQSVEVWEEIFSLVG